MTNGADTPSRTERGGGGRRPASRFTGRAGRGPSLRLLLTFAFLSLLLAAVGVTGFLLIRNSQRGVEEVTGQLRRELAGHVHDYVAGFLETPHRVNRLNADLIRRGLLDVRDPDALSRHFWHQRGEFEDLSFLFFGTAQGGSAGAGRNSDGVVVVDSTDRVAGGGLVSGVRREYRAGASGERRELLKETAGFDARRRPWFEAAAARGGAVWSDVYPLFAERTLAVAASQPVHGPGGELLGVLGADLGLDRLGGFLRGLRVGQTGRVFIVERANGLLVASSSSGAPLGRDPRSGDWSRLAAADSPEPLVAATAEHLEERFGGDLSRIFGGQLSFSLAGERQLVDLVPLTDPRGLDWLIAVAVPEADFTGPIAASTRDTLWLCLVALAAALAAAIGIARSVTRPLLDLTRASRALAGGRLDQRVEVDGIGEVEELAQSFNAMAGQLERSFEELESRVEERTAELSAAKEEAVAANRAKSDFLSTVSHEVRTPLAAILGYADLLSAGGASPEEVGQGVATIRDNGEILGRLVDDLLDLNRIESGVLELDERWVDLSTVLVRSHLVVASPAAAKGLELRLESAGRLPREVLVDPLRLGQVLLNLLDNAVKYTASGTVTLALAADPAAGPQGASLILRVIDTGAGIAPELHARVFEPFVRLDTRGEEGVGLGLAIARRLIERMGGRIEVESRLGAGSEFIVRLPIHGAAEWAEPAAGWSEVATGGDVALQRAWAAGAGRLSGRVLVADDSLSLRDLLAKALAGWGLDCEVAVDGRAAVAAAAAAAASEEPFDLVLMDWKMPRMGGLEALAELRRRGLELPVVALTASATAADRERCLAAGCSAHLVKPLDFGRLHRVLSELLAAGASPTSTPDDVAELVARYRRGLPEKMAELRSAAAACDWSRLRRAAHRLAGTAGSFGVEPVAEQAAALEADATEVAAGGRDPGSIASRLESLAAAVSIAASAAVEDEG